jgi:hypothetical protein
MSAQIDFAAIKSSIKLSTIVSRRVKLKQADAELVGCCPFHPDKTPSFFVNDEKGVYLCRGCKATGDVFNFVMSDQGVSLKEAAQILSGGDAGTNAKPTAPTIYTYQNADGSTAFRVHRNAEKGFSCSRPNGIGGWEWKKPGVVVPYRLPELLAADLDQPVFIVEGEKDADNLAALGCVTTTNPFGAGKWPATFASYLAERDVVILPDNDQPGRDHAEDVAKKIAGIARSVVVVNLPGLPAKGDVSNWIEAGGTIDGLFEIIAASPPWSARASSQEPANGKPQRKFGSLSASALGAKKFAPVRYVIPGLLPEGLALLAGKPKFGKSYAALDLCIAVSTGGMALGVVQCEAGDALYCALEDPERRLRDRIREMLPLGEDMPERLFIETVASRLDGGLIVDLKGWLFDHPDARLIVLDTLARIKPDSSGRATLYDEDARGLTPLHELTRDHPGVAVVIIHHTRKMEADDCFDTISGSTGLTGICDTLMVLARHGEGAKLSGQGRDIEGFEKALTRNALTGSWRITGDAKQLAKTGERQALLDVLAEADGEALRTSTIAKGAGVSETSASHRLKSLLKEGLIVRAGYGKWKLLDPRQSSQSRQSGNDDSDDDNPDFDEIDDFDGQSQ